MATPDAFAQLALAFTDPFQHEYEIIRPVVLFAETVAERSRQTGVERTQVGKQARRFVKHGMLGLADGRAGQSGRTPHVYPDPVATYLIYIKQLYPAIHHHELARIVQRTFGYTTNHSTIKRFVALNKPPAFGRGVQRRVMQRKTNAVGGNYPIIGSSMSRRVAQCGVANHTACRSSRMTVPLTSHSSSYNVTCSPGCNSMPQLGTTFRLRSTWSSPSIVAVLKSV